MTGAGLGLIAFYSPVNSMNVSMSSYIHYKGYVGNIEFPEADATFHGRVVGIKSLISFEGDGVGLSMCE
jgi:hypothetical protein